MTDPVMSAAPAVAAAPAPISALDQPSPPSRSWIGRVCIVLLLLALFTPAQAYGDDRYMLPMITKWMCIALFALSVDLVWGYTGLLSLGQGLYFGLGVYAMGYSLKLQRAAILAATQAHTEPDFAPGPSMAMPDFMGYCGLTHVPFWIAPFINIWFAIALAIAVPTVIAALFGAVAFARRIKGVYFSLITQAVLLAVFTLVDNQQPYTGGRVGMTYLAKLHLFGVTFDMQRMFLLVTGILVVVFLVCYFLTGSKFGKLLTAIRDNEYRVMALGYNTAMYKTFVFALAGAIAGLAGAMYAASTGTAGPDRFGVVASIEIVIMVAVGGRGTLIGAILGALLVSVGENKFSELKVGDSDIQLWPIIMGALFIGVVLFMPNGIMGALRNLTARLQKRFSTERAS